MQKSDLFAYLAAFVSIVLAVALSDMVQSTHRLLRAGRKVRWDPLTPLLAFITFLSVLSEFFGLWGDARFDRLTFYGLVGFMAVPTLQALVAFAVLPDDVPENGLDLRRFYFDNRRYLVLLMSLMIPADFFRTIRWMTITGNLSNRDVWLLFGPVNSAQVMLLVVIYISRSWRVQLAALLLMLLLGHFAYGEWYIEPASAPS